MRVQNLAAHTGVEVLDLDLTRDVSSETKKQLQNLLSQHAVVAFRNQKLDPPGFMKAAQIFGEIMPQMLERFTLPEHPLVGFVSSEVTDKPGDMVIWDNRSVMHQANGD